MIPKIIVLYIEISSTFFFVLPFLVFFQIICKDVKIDIQLNLLYVSVCLLINLIKWKSEFLERRDINRKIK